MDPLLRDVLTVLALCGSTLVVTRGFILAKFRARFEDHELAYELVRCPLCAGAWIGAIGWLLIGLLFGRVELALVGESVIVGLAVAFLSAAVGGADARG